jgi:hypothetical protein
MRGTLELGAGVGSRWVGGAAVLCALHCLFTPALALALPALAGDDLERWALMGMAVVAVPLGAGGFVRHRHRGTVLALAAGLALWAASLSGLLGPVPEPLASGAAGLLTAGALFWNARLLHRHTCV